MRKFGSPKNKTAITQTPLTTQAFEPLPDPTGSPPFHLSLSDVITNNSENNSLIFHVTGDVGGVKSPEAQQIVAQKMEEDFSQAPAPQFLYLVGDVVYYNGEPSKYYDQFYEPYSHYPAPIFAIPGNHDGDPINSASPSLAGFMQNFCAPHPQQNGRDEQRQTMTQPNCYWSLMSDYVTMIGLYTNVPEGGVVQHDQQEWFVRELMWAPKDKPIIVSLHHPPYSADQHHSGSTTMVKMLENAYQVSGRFPDMVFAGHVHNYQRFSKTFDSRIIPYIVIGNGGYWHLHAMMQKNIPLPYAFPDQDLTLESYCDDRHGFMRVEIVGSKIIGKFYTVPRPHESWSNPASLYDSFTLDWQQHTIS